MIRADSLIRKFRSGDIDIFALNDISFEVKAGEFISVIGRSGSGKSTLLYQLGLLDFPTSGTVYLEGYNASDLSEDERTDIRLKKLGYVFQDYALIPELTSLENVIIPLLMQGLSYSKSKIKALDALEKIGLGERLGNLPNQLSGGEQQRVSVARAIGHDPKILFADEPTANLDHETSLSVIRAFQELNRLGQTIIMVTHEAEYAALTHRIITLFDGKIMSDKPVGRN